MTRIRSLLILPIAALAFAGCAADEATTSSGAAAARETITVDDVADAVTVTVTETVTAANTHEFADDAASVPATTAKPAAKPAAKPKKARPIRFEGNGSKTLPPFTIKRDANLTWTNDGDLFQVFPVDFAEEGSIGVNSQAHSGSTYVAAGTHQMDVNAIGNWTILLDVG